MTKITLLCFFLTVVQAMAVNSYAQTTRMSLKAENERLENVFNKIEQESEFFFLYNKDLIDVEQKVSVDAQNETIKAILDEVLSGKDIAFRVFNRQIVLSNIEMMNEVVAQQNRISGTVTDQSGQPLPGVTVIIRGTTQGTVTNAEGNYSLTGVPEDATLVFSFVGMQTQEIEVGDRTAIDVTMVVDAIGIEEIVAVGYGTQKRVNLTGSVATIESKELVEVPVANTGQTLAGRIPGLYVKENTGKPGSVPSISIRNYGSPLIIVDGVEQANFHNIDPSEIESFSILKDASAAIYGSKAGNGVILITTKRGQGKATINVSSSYSLQQPTAYPRFLSTWDFARASNEIGQYTKEVRERNGQEYVYEPWNAIPGYEGPYSEAEIEEMRNGSLPNTNWVGVALNDFSPMQNHNINVSGKNEKVGYFVSAAYTNQVGLYKSGDASLNRYNIRSNIDVTVAQNLELAMDLSVRNSDTKDVYIGEDQIWMSLRPSMPYYPATYPDPTKIPYSGWDALNVLNTTNADKSGYDRLRRNYLTGLLSLKYNVPFIKGLAATAKVNYVGDSQYRKRFGIPFTTWQYDEQNDNYFNPITQNQDYDFLDRRYENRRITYQGLLEFDRSFGEHNIKALGVYEAIDFRSNQMQGTIKGFISPAIDQIFAGNSETQTLSGTAYEEGNISYVGRFNYNYLGKYLFESTLRVDGSSRFYEDVRWGTFPSVALGWRISEEDFIKSNLSFFDNIKLRASYSQTGYDRNANAYQYLTTYSFSGVYVFNGVSQSGITTDGLVNRDVTWETMDTYNAGIDVSMWQGLFGFEVDYFYRLRDNILATRLSTLPNTFGASLPQENLNSIDNRGVEIVLNHNKQIGEFNYSLSGNFTWTRAKYVDVEEQEYEDEDLARLNVLTGRWQNIQFGYETDGFLTAEDLVYTETSGINYDQSSTPNSTLAPGMPKYVDQNDDRIIDWRDQVQIGKGSTPEIMYGINGDASFKNFDFSMLWQGATAYDIVLSDHMRYPVGGGQDGGNIPQFLFDGRWTPESTDAKFPRLADNRTYLGKTADMFLFSAGYLRLKNLTFGYSLPGSVLNHVKGFSNVRFYFAGYNLITFNKLKDFNIDPERGGGYDGRYYPQYKSFSFGVNITLQ